MAEFAVVPFAGVDADPGVAPVVVVLAPPAPAALGCVSGLVSGVPIVALAEDWATAAACAAARDWAAVALELGCAAAAAAWAAAGATGAGLAAVDGSDGGAGELLPSAEPSADAVSGAEVGRLVASAAESWVPLEFGADALVCDASLAGVAGGGPESAWLAGAGWSPAGGVGSDEAVSAASISGVSGAEDLSGCGPEPTGDAASLSWPAGTGVDADAGVGGASRAAALAAAVFAADVP